MEFLKNLFEKAKSAVKSQSKKRIIENCVIVIIIGVVAIIAGGSLLKDTGKEDYPDLKVEEDAQTAAKVVSAAEEKDDLQKRLESILSKIEGAGNISVMLTYTSSIEKVPAYDTKRTDNDTQEKDNGGGTRNITDRDVENKVAFEENGSGGKKPIILKELQPPVKGVVVVADGASEPVVKESISRAVQVLVDIPVHKIQVLPRNK